MSPGWPDGDDYLPRHVEKALGKFHARACSVVKNERLLEGRVPFAIESLVIIRISAADLGMAANHLLTAWLETRETVSNNLVQLQVASHKNQKDLDVSIYFGFQNGGWINAGLNNATSLMNNLCNRLVDAGYCSCTFEELHQTSA